MHVDWLRVFSFVWGGLGWFLVGYYHSRFIAAQKKLDVAKVILNKCYGVTSFGVVNDKRCEKEECP